jgi:hypothetical protein
LAPRGAPIAPAYVLDFRPAAALPQKARDTRHEPRTVWIYQPCRNVMQHGARARRWILEFGSARAPQADHLMGWVGQGDPRQSLRLIFPTKAHAIAFARRQGWSFELAQPATGAATVHDLDLHRRPPACLAGLGQWQAVV